MKKLDDILLEDIKSIIISEKKLIIYTKTETFEYNYPNNLELLRRISYFIHRYRIECQEKADKNIQILDNHFLNIKKNKNKIFNKFSKKHFRESMILVLFSFIFGLNTIIFSIYLGFLTYNLARLIIDLKKENLTFPIEQVLENNDFLELQNMQIVFNDLKIQALIHIDDLEEQLLNNIKNDTNTDKNIIDFLEDIPYIYEEKEFQKSLGHHPSFNK